MIMYLLLLTAEMVLLFLLSKQVQEKIGRFFFSISKNKKWAVYAMSALFLPGTFVHESAHFMMALFLLVPVGNMRLIPKINQDMVELGSVSIAKTDFIRRFFISIAPFLIGTGVVLAIVFLYFDHAWYKDFWLTVMTSYVVFTVSNTMFISKKDSQGIWGFVLFIILIIVFMILFGLNINLKLSDISAFDRIISNVIMFLAAPVVLDILIFIVLK